MARFEPTIFRSDGGDDDHAATVNHSLRDSERRHDEVSVDDIDCSRKRSIASSRTIT
jgi:hypothetical protein